MASLVEARDPYTGGHLWRVSQFSKTLAAAAGLPLRDIARITVGGFLHDLGKIAIPDAVLRKTDRLTDDEYAIIRTHPEVGYRLLTDHPLAFLVKEAVLSHHERPDGKGYPHQLSQDQLSIDARIVGLTDAFDAMTSTRPYRQGMPLEKALKIIEECSGTQFDAELAKVFVEIGRNGELDHIIGHSDLGIPMQDCPACGPIIVVKRDQKEGDCVYCRNCSYRTYIIRDHGVISLADTEEHGTPEELQPDIDILLIQELIKEAAKAIK